MIDDLQVRGKPMGNFWGIFICTPVLAVACLITAAAFIYTDDGAADRCEDLLPRFSSVEIRRHPYAPGLRCIGHNGTSNITVDDLHWVAWSAHLLVLVGSVALLWFLLTSRPYYIIVALGTFLYILVALAVSTLATLPGIVIGIGGLLLRGRQERRAMLV